MINAKKKKKYCLHISDLRVVCNQLVTLFTEESTVETLHYLKLESPAVEKLQLGYYI